MHPCEPFVVVLWCTPRILWCTPGCTVHTGWRALLYTSYCVFIWM